MTDSDYKFFNKANQAALISDFLKTRIGCVAVYHGKVIGVGCNCNKTHPAQKYYNRFRDGKECLLPKLHAEISCINSIKHLDINFSKVKLYIYRVRNDRPHGLARPCPSCMAAIKDLGIRDVYYTTNEGLSYERLDFTEENNVVSVL
jgi:deoxycytidylate deaminase